MDNKSNTLWTHEEDKLLLSTDGSREQLEKVALATHRSYWGVYRRWLRIRPVDESKPNDAKRRTFAERNLIVRLRNEGMGWEEIAKRVGRGIPAVREIYYQEGREVRHIQRRPWTKEEEEHMVRREAELRAENPYYTVVYILNRIAEELGRDIDAVRMKRSRMQRGEGG